MVKKIFKLKPVGVPSKQLKMFDPKHDREYVEFLNDFIVAKPYTSMLILLPNIVMITDLSIHFKTKENFSAEDLEIQKFFHNISYVGISEAIT